MNTGTRWGKLSAARAAAILLATGLAASACSAPPPGMAASLSPPISFDGRYVGTVRVTGTAGGMRMRDCEVPSRISLDVRNNQFVYAQPHPHAAAQLPEPREKTTPIYRATIGQDGTITGISDQTNATMTGRVADGRMSGEIYGLLCYYSFTADPV